MFLNAYEFGRKITNAVVYDDTKVAVQPSAGVEKISEASLPKLLKKFQEINARRKAEGLGILALALPLSACGGGSSSTDSGADDEPAVVYDTITTAGRAIDGYLADSTVSFATFALPDAPAAPLGLVELCVAHNALTTFPSALAASLPSLFRICIKMSAFSDGLITRI